MAGVDGRAVGQEGMGGCIAAIVLQGAEARVGGNEIRRGTPSITFDQIVSTASIRDATIGYINHTIRMTTRCIGHNGVAQSQ